MGTSNEFLELFATISRFRIHIINHEDGFKEILICNRYSTSENQDVRNFADYIIKTQNKLGIQILKNSDFWDYAPLLVKELENSINEINTNSEVEKQNRLLTRYQNQINKADQTNVYTQEYDNALLEIEMVENFLKMKELYIAGIEKLISKVKLAESFRIRRKRFEMSIPVIEETEKNKHLGNGRLLLNEKFKSMLFFQVTTKLHEALTKHGYLQCTNKQFFGVFNIDETKSTSVKWLKFYSSLALMIQLLIQYGFLSKDNYQYDRAQLMFLDINGRNFTNKRKYGEKRIAVEELITSIVSDAMKLQSI